MTGSTSLTGALVRTLARPVGLGDRRKARTHLLDWLACVAGARQSAVAAVGPRAMPDVLERVAFLGSVLEMDDVHRTALLHPGPVIWPAALSAARETGASMDQLLDGAVRGYEAMIAIGASLDAHHYSLWHPTSTAGGFGAAAAACFIFGLSDDQTLWALGNAGSVAGGLWHLRHADVMTKSMHVARAALEGLWMARLARGGFTGPAAILEGAQGVYAAMAEAPRPLAQAADGGWLIHEVSLKPWAACRHAHPAIDCALELRASGQLSPPFHVESYADAIRFCDRPDPVTETDAKFSLQHAIAVIAAGRDATPADFTADAIAALAGLRAMATVAEAPAFTAAYPAHFGARLRAGGAEVALPDTRGDPERPLHPEGQRAKLDTLVAWGGLPPGEAHRAAACALDGDSVADLLAIVGDWLR
jgi:2-methylcitrate dehydratase PrpD